MALGHGLEPGQTPLSEEESVGLKIQSVTTLGELDEFEQENIEQALKWTIGRKIRPDSLLSEQFVKSLHKRMYSDVWKWAGNFRQSEKNIGIPSWKIPTELKILLDDVQFWIQHASYSDDEIAIRFKHRLVSIHCFPNGNGRHSRLMADLIAEKLFSRPVFSWGQTNLSRGNDVRSEYLKALKKADNGDYIDLTGFARS